MMLEFRVREDKRYVLGPIESAFRGVPLCDLVKGRALA